MEDDCDDDKPLLLSLKANAKGHVPLQAATVDDSDDDKPLLLSLKAKARPKISRNGLPDKGHFTAAAINGSQKASRHVDCFIGGELPSTNVSQQDVKQASDDFNSGGRSPVTDQLHSDVDDRSLTSGLPDQFNEKCKDTSDNSADDDKSLASTQSEQLLEISRPPSDDSGDDDMPLASAQTDHFQDISRQVCGDSNDDDDDKPLESVLNGQLHGILTKGSDDSDDDKPLSSVLNNGSTKENIDDSDDDDMPLASVLPNKHSSAKNVTLHSKKLVSLKQSSVHTSSIDVNQKVSTWKVYTKRKILLDERDKVLPSKMPRTCSIQIMPEVYVDDINEGEDRDNSEDDSHNDDDDSGDDTLLAKYTSAGRKKRMLQKNSSKGGLAAKKVQRSVKSEFKQRKRKKSISESDDEDEVDEGDDSYDNSYDDDDDDYEHASAGKKRRKLKNDSSKIGSAAKKARKSGNTEFKQKKKKKLISDVPGAGGGIKWTTLEHNGVVFPPPYKPHGVKMFYNGEPVDLTPEQEEVATMFAVMRETEYVTKAKFLANFWNDWKKLLGPNHVIQKLEGCDFTPIYEWFLAEKEKKNQMSTEDKKRLKEEKYKQEEKYMWALVDGVKEKIGNFRVEPPALFRGRGEHPKMGKLKQRIFPEDIVINIGADAPVPECPILGHRWKEVRHDNTVTWLAYWNDPINVKEQKYVFLAPSSSLKGQSDKEKYEKARMLKDYIEDIRVTYIKNFSSSDPTTKQIAVATYLIDRLALRAGNEKDDDEADTVGCCSLKVEHVTLVPPKSLQFDFLGKDSIRYLNVVEVCEPVYRAIGEFKASKKTGEDLFDRLDTNKLNAHLKEIMPHLTAKVFRTYNASITLDTLIAKTDGHQVLEKLAAYQRANKEVAILCNHQRSVSKSHESQMGKLEGKLSELNDLLKELEIDLERASKGKPPLNDADGKPKRNQNPEVLEKKIFTTKQRMEKVKLDMSIKDDLKTVALGTSKINYMDPRITVAWCKRHEVPIEKVFNKSLLAKFSWAMDVDMNFRF